MNLKPCPCCKKQQTTRNAEYKGRMELGVEMLTFNCRSCNSTFVVMKKADAQRLVFRRLAA